MVDMAKLLILFVISLALAVNCFEISSTTCGEDGFRPSQLNDRIVGGQPAQSGWWPWMGSVMHKVIPGYRFCGASLITPGWAVSAAHCFKFTLTDPSWMLEFGKYDNQKNENYTRYFDIKKVSYWFRKITSSDNFCDLDNQPSKVY